MNKIISEDAITAANSNYVPWEKLRNKTVLITGANGYVPSYFVHTLLNHNDLYGSNIRVIALCRNKEKAIRCFAEYLDRNDFILHIQDVCDPILIENEIHFFIHAASPAGYHIRHEKPADTYKANVIGCLNLLELSRKNPCEGFLLISSVDIYGHVTHLERLTETDYGYLDLLNSRNAYSLGKCAAEALSNTYHIQYDIPITIVRPFQILGIGLALDDGRLHIDFISQLLSQHKIVLRGDGSPKRSLMYITDAMTGILTVLLKGTQGEAYNVCDEKGEITVLELAELMLSLLADKNRCVEFDDSQRNTPAVRDALPCVLGDSAKLKKLGWLPQVSLTEGLRRVMQYYGLELIR